MLLLLIILSSLVAQTLSAAGHVDVRWEGGTPVCDESKCDNGSMCMDSFACDSGQYWNNGTQVFIDPMNPEYAGRITSITMVISGAFGCSYYSTTTSSFPSTSTTSMSTMKQKADPVKYFTLSVYLNGLWLANVQAETSDDCTCKNCASTSVFTRYLVSGWPSYQYGKNNTVQVIPTLASCLSSASIYLNYQNPPTPTTSSSTMGTTSIPITTDSSLLTTGSSHSSMSSSSSTSHGHPTTTTEFSTTQFVTTGNSTGDPSNTHALILMGSFMLGGMICVNVLLLGGWYVWRKHKEMEEKEGKKKGGRGSRRRSFLDKAVAFRDIMIGERIGRGSFGEVYRGIWLQTDVAVKKLPADILNNAELVEEFNQEVRLLRSLMHPNILQFMGACLIPPDICLITEYIPRGDLYKIIHDNSVSLDWPLIKKIIIDVSRGMHYLHSSNPVIIHRDLKSHNVLIGEHWNAKVADFGLCKIIRDQATKGKFTPCGTPKWAAPEVLRNEAYTTKADVYSFGIILWEMASRQDVFPGMSAFELIMQVGRNNLRPTIPTTTFPPFAALIADCWNADPDQRPSFARILSIVDGL